MYLFYDLQNNCIVNNQAVTKVKSKPTRVNSAVARGCVKDLNTQMGLQLNVIYLVYL